MKLYKYHGVIIDLVCEEELIDDNVRDTDEAFDIINDREFEPGERVIIRIIGPCDNGDYHFDFGNWSTFYMLTE